MILRTLQQTWRRGLLNRRGVSFRGACRLGNAVDFVPGFTTQRGRIVVGPDAELGQGTVLHAYGGSIELGKNVFLGPYVVIYGHGGVTIGDHTLISMHCRVLSSNHTVPAQGVLIRDQLDVLLPTKIGRDVWLGAGVTVLGGVTIGDGCVVGAGAVVTKSLPPGAIAMGVPARITGQRS